MQLRIEKITNIKKAAIHLNGITVLIGSNQSGKTAVCRALTCLSQAANSNSASYISKSIMGNRINFSPLKRKEVGTVSLTRGMKQIKLAYQDDLCILCKQEFELESSYISADLSVVDSKPVHQLDPEAIEMAMAPILRLIENVSGGVISNKDSLSNGEKLFFALRELALLGAFHQNSICILDTPDAFLHPSWQKKLSQVLIQIHQLTICKFFITTYSDHLIDGIRDGGKEVGLHPNFYTMIPRSDRFMAVDITNRPERNRLRTEYSARVYGDGYRSEGTAENPGVNCIGDDNSIHRAVDMAKFIINDRLEAGDPVTLMKLQRLLFYIQASFLVEFGRPAFWDAFTIGKYGPVIITLMETYGRYCNDPIGTTFFGELAKERGEFDCDYLSLASKECNLIKRVINGYQMTSGMAILNKVLAEKCWPDDTDILQIEHIANYYRNLPEKIYNE